MVPATEQSSASKQDVGLGATDDQAGYDLYNFHGCNSTLEMSGAEVGWSTDGRRMILDRCKASAFVGYEVDMGCRAVLGDWPESRGSLGCDLGGSVLQRYVELDGYSAL